MDISIPDTVVFTIWIDDKFAWNGRDKKYVCFKHAIKRALNEEFIDLELRESERYHGCFDCDKEKSNS